MDHDAIRLNHAACELLAEVLQQFTRPSSSARRYCAGRPPGCGGGVSIIGSDVRTRLLATSTLHYCPLGSLALWMCLNASSSHCPRRMTAGIVPASYFFHVERGVSLLTHGRTWSYAGDAWCDSSMQSSGQCFRSDRILESNGSSSRERGCAEGDLLAHQHSYQLRIVASTAAYSPFRGAESPPHPAGGGCSPP